MIFSLFFSCITASHFSTEMIVDFNKSNNQFSQYELNVRGGTIKHEDDIIMIHFESVRGGVTQNFLTGETTIRSGDDGNRFSVTCDQGTVVRFTRNEMQKWLLIDSVFIAPKLCQDPLSKG